MTIEYKNETKVTTREVDGITINNGNSSWVEIRPSTSGGVTVKVQNCAQLNHGYMSVAVLRAMTEELLDVVEALESGVVKFRGQ